MSTDFFRPARNIKVIFTVLTVSLCFSMISCVSQKVFLDMEQQKNSCIGREKRCLEREKACNDTNALLKSLIDSLNGDLASLDSADKACRQIRDSFEHIP